MKYNFINKLNSSQLKELESIILDEKRREPFLKEINALISSRENRNNNIAVFAVEEIPYYDEKLENKCLDILKELSIENFYFLTRSFVEKRNGESLFANKAVLDYLADCSGLSNRMLMMGLENPSVAGHDICLGTFEKFFSEESLQKRYKRSFNIYNYIKSYIYQCLRKDSEINRKVIFSDYGFKQLIVEKRLQEVAAYLLEIRGTGDLKCAIANAGLSRTAKKVSGEVTFNQRRLVEAVAFGTTLEKLNAGNYEDSKKLIYLP